MYATYIALLDKADKKTAYGVMFPDFLGCIASGKSVDKAIENARKALAFHMEGMIDSGEVIPKPSKLEKILKDPDNKKVIPALMRIIIPSGHIKRLNITMDTALLTELDRAAKMVGRNRSEFLADAVREAIG